MSAFEYNRKSNVELEEVMFWVGFWERCDVMSFFSYRGGKNGGKRRVKHYSSSSVVIGA